MSSDFDWSRLNHLRVGRYAEYFVKMAFTHAGLDVYSAEVDDKGIDFVIRRDARTYFDVQVKSIRGLNYVFFPKDKFKVAENLWAAVVVYLDGERPRLFLIPSQTWMTPSALFVDREYGSGKKSKPEWGLNLSTKNLPLLEPFSFDEQVGRLVGAPA
jgi:hypothetical protein